jgi:hypothetical protein
MTFIFKHAPYQFFTLLNLDISRRYKIVLEIVRINKEAIEKCNYQGYYQSGNLSLRFEFTISAKYYWLVYQIIKEGGDKENWGK